MSFLYNNVAAIAVALVASVLVWLFGGSRGDLLIPVVPWLFVLLLEAAFCFPQRHRGESTYEARARTWQSLKRDPVAWVCLGLFVLLLIPLVNNGLCPVCDWSKISQGIDPSPAASFLPTCVDRLAHLNVVFWFALTLLMTVTVRCCLTHSGQRTVLELIMWNGAVVAVVGFLQGATGAPGPLWCPMKGGGAPGAFFATFGYPNMAGDYFTSLFAIAIALWRHHYAEVRKDYDEKAKTGDAVDAPRAFWNTHYFLLPAILFFFAALNTLSRAAIILVSSCATLYFVHTLVCFLAPMKKARRFFIGGWCLLAFGLLIFFSSVFMPENLQREVDTLETNAVLDRVTGKGQYHSHVAFELWKDHRLFGCGGWGYQHLCMTKMTPAELKGLQVVGGANVHNDYLQFLVEHGLVGLGLMIALGVLLVWPVCRDWKRLVRGYRFKKKGLPPRPVIVFALPAAVFVLFMSVVATLIHAFGDCPLRSPAVLSLLYVSLAAMPGFMPVLEEEPDERESHAHAHSRSHH